MAYESTAASIDELKRSLIEVLAESISQLNRINAHLELMTDVEDPPREPTDDFIT